MGLAFKVFGGAFSIIWRTLSAKNATLGYESSLALFVATTTHIVPFDHPLATPSPLPRRPSINDGQRKSIARSGGCSKVLVVAANPSRNLTYNSCVSRSCPTLAPCLSRGAHILETLGMWAGCGGHHLLQSFTWGLGECLGRHATKAWEGIQWHACNQGVFEKGCGPKRGEGMGSQPTCLRLGQPRV